MNDNAKKWVEALRSKEFEQTRGILHCIESTTTYSPVGHCCLGVACEVAIQNGVKINRGVRKERTQTIEVFAGSTASLPREVRDWLGMGSDNGLGYFHGGSLSAMNDNHKTFEEIADKIESEPEGLFV
jgi:hypothetical protein